MSTNLYPPASSTPSYPAPTVQDFTSSGTYTKPAGATRVVVELISGGAGGDYGDVKIGLDYPHGGCGGGYLRREFLASSLAATTSVTVGAGSPGVSSGLNNSPGGNSMFGNLTCRGGGRSPVWNYSSVGGNYGGTAGDWGTASNTFLGQGHSSAWGGGGGGATGWQNSTSPYDLGSGADGGSSGYGAGGGGGAPYGSSGSFHAGAGGAGGTSADPSALLGGNGGGGAWGGASTDGFAPGGGGGATGAGTGGAGARGQVRVTTYFGPV